MITQTEDGYVRLKRAASDAAGTSYMFTALATIAIFSMMSGIHTPDVLWVSLTLLTTALAFVFYRIHVYWQTKVDTYQD